MVAYNFMKAFVGDIEDLSKRQTIRGHRKRHARPGEPVQLFTGMRTRYCRKILNPDPICDRIAEIRIDIAPRTTARSALAITIDGIPILGEDLEALARADGFGTLADKHELDPVEIMSRFWASTYGVGVFEGVVIYWDPMKRSNT